MTTTHGVSASIAAHVGVPKVSPGVK